MKDKKQLSIKMPAFIKGTNQKIKFEAKLQTSNSCNEEYKLRPFMYFFQLDRKIPT